MNLHSQITKNLYISFAAVLLLCVTSGDAFAQAKKSGTTENPFAFSSVSGSSTGAYPQWGLGVASATNVVRSTTAASLWWALNNDQAIQAYLAIPATSPFSLGVGGIYKHTISGGNYSGFHVGGGFGLGSAATGATGNAFFVHFLGVFGMHFYFPGLKNVLINIDAGPTFVLLSGQANFAIAALSDVLGLSVHYVF